MHCNEEELHGKTEFYDLCALKVDSVYHYSILMLLSVAIVN